MEVEPRKGPHIAPFIVTVVFLLAMAGGAITLLVITTHVPISADDKSRKIMARMAAISVTMLGLTAIMLFWVISHFLMQRFRSQEHHARTEYVDAWSLAGKRVKPVEDESADDDDDEDDEGGKT